MVNLLAQHEFRPPGEREQRDRDDRRDPQRPLHSSARDRRGAQGVRFARPLLLTAQYDEAEAERHHGTREEVGAQRLERRGETGTAQAERDGDQRPGAAERRRYGGSDAARGGEYRLSDWRRHDLPEPRGSGTRPWVAGPRMRRQAAPKCAS